MKCSSVVVKMVNYYKHWLLMIDDIMNIEDGLKAFSRLDVSEGSYYNTLNWITVRRCIS